MKTKFTPFSYSIALAVSLATVIGFLSSVAEAATPTDNIGLGSGAGTAVAPNADNIDIGNPGGGPSETKTIRIGTVQNATYVAGIHSVGIASTLTPLMVVIGSNGQLGTATALGAASDENRNLGGTTGNCAAEGVQALNPANTGNDNTATGWNALIKNTSGGSNTANGKDALTSNTTGSGNTASGEGALLKNTTSNANTATGYQALSNNSASGTATKGEGNTATGHWAMLNNTFGYDNTATGRSALLSNTTGLDNTVAGNEVLYKNTTGSFNIALGYRAGETLSSGNNNIYIGNPGPNPAGGFVAAESGKIRIGTNVPGPGQQQQNATYIAGIFGVPVTGQPVSVDASGHLGSPASSQRFKDQIKPMDNASEAILSLKPVTFRYRREIDPNGMPQFGLVAEEVEKVNSDLVARDAEGKVYSVRYEAVNAMLLNEFLKEHRKVQEQETTITQLRAAVAQQQKGMEVLAASLKEQAAQIAKVNTQIEATRSVKQFVANRQ